MSTGSIEETVARSNQGSGAEALRAGAGHDGRGATWRHADGNQPVILAAPAGEAEGVEFWRVAGSATAIPAHELWLLDGVRLDLGRPLADFAVELAAAGFAVLPLRARSKEPACPHGCKDATTDEDTLRAWWRRMPDANVAVATGEASG